MSKTKQVHDWFTKHGDDREPAKLIAARMKKDGIKGARDTDVYLWRSEQKKKVQQAKVKVQGDLDRNGADVEGTLVRQLAKLKIVTNELGIDRTQELLDFLARLEG